MQLFLDSSTATKLKLIHLTQAFCDDDEVDQALSADLFNPSTEPKTRDNIYWAFENPLNPKLGTPEFLKKLLDNQLGPKEQRVKFSHLGQVVFDRRSRGPVNFAAQQKQFGMGDGFDEGGGGGHTETKLERTFSGRSAVIFHLLFSLEAIARTPVPEGDREVEPSAVKPILKQILAIKDAKDPNLKATAEDLEALVVFKNAAWLLEQIEKSELP